MAEPNHNMKKGAFPTTHWTVINALKRPDNQEKESLFVEFVEQYLPAFRLHLTHARGFRNEADIEDAIQGFLTDKFVIKNILEHVHKDRGRLRDYLRRCLDNYCYEQHRSLASKAWDQRITWDDSGLCPDELRQTTEICPFDIGWANTVMTETIIRTKDQFFHSQRQHVWDVFDLCIVRPLFTGIPAIPYSELAEEMGLSVKAVQNRRVSALRAFGKHLTAVIAEYVGNDPDSIDMEISDLNTIMRSGAFQDTSDGLSY